MNLPNKLTLSRVIMIPVFMLFFFLPFDGHYLVAAFIFVLAALTDMLDGKIARKYNLVTNLGKFLDPIADKVLVSTALILMITVSGDFFTAFVGADVVWPTVVGGICVAVILARETIISGFRMVAASAGLVIAADKVGKVKTVFQDVSIAILLVSASFVGATGTGYTVGLLLNMLGSVCFAAATVLTVVSGVNYLVVNKHVLKSE